MRYYYYDGFLSIEEDKYCKMCGELLIDFIDKTYFDKITGEKVEIIGKRCGKPWYKKLGGHYSKPSF